VWGNTTFRKLGSYTYQSDTITMSPILRGNARYLDYVMFHEMLHKKHRYYKTKTGRMAHHHTAFKNDEATYPEVEKINKELQWFVAKQKIKGFLFD
jgi:predicted metal-dependent hydrolase